MRKVPRRLLTLLLAAGLLAGPAAQAQVLPDAVLQASEPAASAPATRDGVVLLGLHLESNGRGAQAVPFPAAVQTAHAETFLDVRAQQPLAERLSARVALRITADRTRYAADPPADAVRLDLRELQLRQDLGGGYSFSTGRLVLRSGVGYAFNPGDFFGRFAAVDRSTQDPLVAREIRLGTVAAQLQRVGETLSLSLQVSPRLEQPASLRREARGADPQLGRTNGMTRSELRLSAHLADGLEPELALYRDSTGWRTAANLTQGVGDSTVLFAEWAGGQQYRLADAARVYAAGAEAGVAPVQAPRPWLHAWSAGINQVLAGGTVLQLAYNYHGAGLDGRQWQDWVTAARAPAPQAAAQAWYLRAYASAMQLPVRRQNLFLRLEWPRLGFSGLSASAFANVDTAGGSALLATELKWSLDDRFSLRLSAYRHAGSDTSVYGSLPQRWGVAAGARLYF